MTRIIKIETCDRCSHVRYEVGEGWRCTEAKVQRHGLLLSRRFVEEDDFPLIPPWCPLEQVAPDWHPPATIDLYGPPCYARSKTDGGIQ